MEIRLEDLMGFQWLFSRSIGSVKRGHHGSSQGVSWPKEVREEFKCYFCVSYSEERWVGSSGKGFGLCDSPMRPKV
jgi:hypothetical protein